MAVRKLISTFIILLFYLIDGYAITLKAKKYDSGVDSSIARQSDTIVEVHSSGYYNTLWYKVGIIKEGKIEWGKSYRYDSGVNASIAIGANTVVEVHKSEVYNTLWYHVGTLDKNTKTISWGDAQMYDEGKNASIAISNDMLIETHQHSERYTTYNDADEKEYSYINTLYYRTGKIDSNTKTIEWTINASYYAYGKNPSIAVSKGIIIETHQSDDSLDLLYSRIGTLQEPIIKWNTTESYDKGVNSSISISENLLVEMHKAPFFDRLWYKIGRIDRTAKTIIWGGSTSYDRGVKPSIVLDDHSLVEVHTSDSFKSLYGNIGIVDKDSATISWSKTQLSNHRK